MTLGTASQPEPASPVGQPARTRGRSSEGGRFHGFLSVSARTGSWRCARSSLYATEAWFWGSQWQSGEREVDEHVRAEQVSVSNSTEELLADLAALDDEATAAAAPVVDEG